MVADPAPRNEGRAAMLACAELLHAYRPIAGKHLLTLNQHSAIRQAAQTVREIAITPHVNELVRQRQARLQEDRVGSLAQLLEEAVSDDPRWEAELRALEECMSTTEVRAIRKIALASLRRTSRMAGGNHRLNYSTRPVQDLLSHLRTDQILALCGTPLIVEGDTQPRDDDGNVPDWAARATQSPKWMSISRKVKRSRNDLLKLDRRDLGSAIILIANACQPGASTFEVSSAAASGLSMADAYHLNW